MYNWFPVSRGLLDSPDFRRLTVHEKLYYVFILSEFNNRGPFYKADLEVAVTLAMSVDKVRVARRKLQRLGWVVARSGRQVRGRNLATQYERVRHARTAKVNTSRRCIASHLSLY